MYVFLQAGFLTCLCCAFHSCSSFSYPSPTCVSVAGGAAAASVLLSPQPSYYQNMKVGVRGGRKPSKQLPIDGHKAGGESTPPSILCWYKRTISAPTLISLSTKLIWGLKIAIDSPITTVLIEKTHALLSTLPSPGEPQVSII